MPPSSEPRVPARTARRAYYRVHQSMYIRYTRQSHGTATNRRAARAQPSMAAVAAGMASVGPGSGAAVQREKIETYLPLLTDLGSHFQSVNREKLLSGSDKGGGLNSTFNSTLNARRGEYFCALGRANLHAASILTAVRSARYAQRNHSAAARAFHFRCKLRVSFLVRVEGLRGAPSRGRTRFSYSAQLVTGSPVTASDRPPARRR